MDRLQELLARLRSGEITEAEQTELNELLHSDLDDLTDDQVAEVEAELVELFDSEREADTPDVETLRGIRDAIVSVRETREAREEAAEQRAAEIDEITGQVHSEDESDEDDDPEGETDESDESDEDGDEQPEGETVESPEGEDGDEQPEGSEQERIAADGQRQRTPLRRLSESRRGRERPRDRREGGRATVVAAANVDGHSAGSEVGEFSDVGRMFAHRFDQLRRSDKVSGRFGVASILLDYPEDRQLGPSAEANSERVERVLAPEGESLLAAGGLCAPVDVSYDLAGIDTDERPLRDGLVRFGAERGGIRFIEPPTLSDVTGGVGIWTEANDSADPPNDPAAKPSVTIVCGTETEVVVDAITARAQIGNFSRMTFPEQFDRWWNLIQSQHARVAENNLWDSMVTASTAATHAEALGATRDLLAGLDQAIAAYRFRNRMARRATLRIALPDYVRDMLRADLARQLAGDETYAVSDQQIDAWFTARNVRPIWVLDAGSNNTFGAQAAGGALVSFPASVETLIFHEGAFLFLDGGRLDLGVEIRDSGLNDTNDSQAFVETFENVAFVGVESLAVTFDLCANGQSQGTVAATICGS